MISRIVAMVALHIFVGRRRLGEGNQRRRAWAVVAYTINFIL
jgi:hypothetical protein